MFIVTVSIHGVQCDPAPRVRCVVMYVVSVYVHGVQCNPAPRVCMMCGDVCSYCVYSQGTV